MTSLDIAAKYLAKGWQPVAVRHRDKAPIMGEWQKQQFAPEDLPGVFRGRLNVGVALGKPSGWLVDVDLDCPEAERLAPRLLPATKAIFGRLGAPRSHWLYVSPETTLARYTAPSSNGGKRYTLCELRSTGGQTVFPGSTHESGEAIEWVGDDPEPAEVRADVLDIAVRKLASASLLVRCGWSDEDAVESVRTGLIDQAPQQVREWLELDRPPPQTQTLTRSHTDIADAMRAYNQDHARDWKDVGGQWRTCPICGHKGCFNALPQDKSRWACWSASHCGAGHEGPTCWTGDALDVDAHAEGVRPIDLLRSQGYLKAPEPQVDEPPPYTDADNPEQGEPETDARPAHELRKGELHEAVYFALRQLSGCQGVYKRANRLVTVVRAAEGPQDSKIQRDDEQPVIAFLSGPRVREILCKQARWVRVDKEGVAHRIDPSRDLVASVHQRGEYPNVRQLLAIVGCPVLRRDGSVWSTPGYDPHSGYYYAPTGAVPEIYDNPTKGEAEAAYLSLLEVIDDFPMAGNEDRASWVACLLSIVGWTAYDGPAPLTLFDANAPGSGKTLAADVLSVIARGVNVARSVWTNNEEEMRKRITTHVLAGDPLVLLDNLPSGSLLGSSSLDSAITGTSWSDRRLGANEKVDMPLNTVWMASGNNIGVQHDAGRRVIRVRIEPAEERPELRTGFRHVPLLGWVRSQRKRLLTAALTLLRAYMLRGETHGKPALGGFEGWDRLVRGAILWAGGADPVECSAGADAGLDPEAVAHRQLMAAWCTLCNSPITGAHLLRLADQRSDDGENIKIALLDLCVTKGDGLPTSRAVGNKLRKLNGRWRAVEMGGVERTLAIVSRGRGKKGHLWEVVEQQ